MENFTKAQALTVLSLNFTGKQADPLLCRMWLIKLQPYTDQQVFEATMRLVDSSKYKTMPTWADFQQFLPAGTAEEQIQTMPAADYAEQLALAEWNHLLETIQEVGMYGTEPEWHPTTAYVLRQLGGYVKCCQTWKEEHMDFHRKDFLSLWAKSHGKTDVLTQSTPVIEEVRIGKTLNAALQNALPPSNGYTPKTQIKGVSGLSDEKDEQSITFKRNCPFCANYGYYNASRDGQQERFICSCQVQNGIPHSQTCISKTLINNGYEILPFDDGKPFVMPATV